MTCFGQDKKLNGRARGNGLSYAAPEDANVNAVIILSAQGDMVLAYVEDSLQEMKYLLREFIERE